LTRIKTSITKTTHHKKDFIHHQKDLILDSARVSKVSASTTLCSSDMTSLIYSLLPLTWEPELACFPNTSDDSCVIIEMPESYNSSRTKTEHKHQAETVWLKIQSAYLNLHYIIKFCKNSQQIIIYQKEWHQEFHSLSLQASNIPIIWQ